MGYYSEVSVFVATFLVFVVFKVGADLLEDIIADKTEEKQRNIRLQVLVLTVIITLIFCMLYGYCAGYGFPTMDSIEELVPRILG